MKTKIHTVYKKKDGTAVAGATTILGILDKPALIHWSWECGIRGEDYRKLRDKAAGVGTIAHYLIECYLLNQKPELEDYTPNDVKQATTAFNAFLDFAKRYKLELIKSEFPLVSEEYGFGGTIDCYCKLDGRLALLDFKTSSGVYPEMRCQVAAYKNLLIENGYPVEETHILRIDKSDGSFEHYPLKDLDLEWSFFKTLTKAYPLKVILWKKR